MPRSTIRHSAGTAAATENGGTERIAPNLVHTVEAPDRAAAFLDAAQRLSSGGAEARVASVGGTGGVPLGLTVDEQAAVRVAGGVLDDRFPHPGVATVVIGSVVAADA